MTVREMWYDSESTSPTTSDIGDGHLTYVRESPTLNSSDDRDTEMRYDYRGRLVTVINPQSPHAHFEYDNLDRTSTAISSTNPAESRRASARRARARG